MASDHPHHVPVVPVNRMLEDDPFEERELLRQALRKAADNEVRD